MLARWQEEDVPIQPMVFERVRAGRLKISAEARSSMQRFLQQRPEAPESGGVLIGRWLLESADVIVDEITMPGPKDYGSRFHFHRDKFHHQQVVDEAWHMSDHTATWLGEWHTHPQPHPVPSCIDRLGWGFRLVRDQAGGEALFFVIAGTSTIGVWEGRCGRPGTQRLRRIG